jgi:Uma2 family endonuclease
MSELIEFDEVLEEEKDMPSIKHSLVQTNIAGTLFSDERFTTFIELSLDATSIDLSQFGLKAKDELVPDVCIYLDPPPVDENLGSDMVRISQYPDLAIEVLSPSQTINELLKKIEAYFALNVKSCWLAIPSLDEVRVFSQLQKYKTFDMNDTEVIDEIMDIRLPIQKMFRKRSNSVQNISRNISESNKERA